MVTAREIAHGRWSLDQPTVTARCGCVYLVLELAPGVRQMDRRTKACRGHDTAWDELGELRGV